MSEQIREQVSAFLDGELPNTETELLLKRLTRDAELRESFGRYALIGDAVRGGNVRLSQGFSARINRSIDGGPAVGPAPALRPAASQWWRPLGGVAVAAGVATVAIVALQQRAVTPSAAVTAQVIEAPAAKEALSYTVPATADVAGTVPGMMPAARLTNYVFAHSQYSSALGQSNVLSGLLTVADDADLGTPRAAGAKQADASPRDSRVAP